MGGDETMRRLLQLDRSVRAIVISGYANSPVMSEHRSFGFQTMLRKPFELERVAEALRETVGIRATG
jgi:two-component system cell cycle sensor histidine kinase/response regulator CckA